MTFQHHVAHELVHAFPVGRALLLFREVALLFPVEILRTEEGEKVIITFLTEDRNRAPQRLSLVEAI
jgi:hypothetical protein